MNSVSLFSPFTGEVSKSSWFSVWFLQPWNGHVYVHTAKKQPETNQWRGATYNGRELVQMYRLPAYSWCIQYIHRGTVKSEARISTRIRESIPTKILTCRVVRIQVDFHQRKMGNTCTNWIGRILKFSQKSLLESTWILATFGKIVPLKNID